MFWRSSEPEGVNHQYLQQHAAGIAGLASDPSTPTSLYKPLYYDCVTVSYTDFGARLGLLWPVLTAVS
jgi:hypothetical protein